MNTKLTLLLRKDVIERAKEEAAERGTSLSKMIEQLLETALARVTPRRSPKRRSSHPAVRQLRGIIKLPPDFNYKKDRAEYLAKKYGL